MPETRDCVMVIRVEPSIKALMSKVEHQDNISTSDYVRKVVMVDLVKRGLLDKELLLKMAINIAGQISVLELEQEAT